MSDKEITCPWCGKRNVPEECVVKKSQKQQTEITERRCRECGKSVAAYLKNEGDFFPQIRVFDNKAN